MKVRVVGCELREGDYQGSHYKNYLLHVVSAVKRDNEIFGVCPSSVKIKAKWVEDNHINLKSLDKQIVEIFYDSYGNVAKIESASE